MRKRKFAAGQAGLDGTINSGAVSSTLKGTQAGASNFGVVNGIKPAARDGHTTDISDDGLLFIFGGDRHHMPFNDLYLMRLWKKSNLLKVIFFKFLKKNKRCYIFKVLYI